MAVEFKESKTFLMIPTGAAYDPDLLKLPKSILVLGEIVSMLNITGSFYMSNSALAKKLDCSTSTIGRYLALLEEKKLIRRKSIKDEKGNIQYRKIYAGEKLAKTFTQNWQADSLTPIPTGDQGVPTHEQGVYPHVTKGIPTCEQPLYPHVSNKENNIREHIKENNIRSNDQLLEDRFEKIWAEYPKKQGKKDAFKHYKAWIKQSSKHTDSYLLQKLSQYKTYLKPIILSSNIFKKAVHGLMAALMMIGALKAMGFLMCQHMQALEQKPTQTGQWMVWMKMTYPFRSLEEL